MTNYFEENYYSDTFPKFYCEFPITVFTKWDYEKIHEYLQEFKNETMSMFGTNVISSIGNFVTNHKSKFQFGVYKAYYGWEIIVWDIEGFKQKFRLITSEDYMNEEQFKYLKEALDK